MIFARSPRHSRECSDRFSYCCTEKPIRPASRGAHEQLRLVCFSPAEKTLTLPRRPQPRPDWFECVIAPQRTSAGLMSACRAFRMNADAVKRLWRNSNETFFVDSLTRPPDDSPVTITILQKLESVALVCTTVKAVKEEEFSPPWRLLGENAKRHLWWKAFNKQAKHLGTDSDFAVLFLFPTSPFNVRQTLQQTSTLEFSSSVLPTSNGRCFCIKMLIEVVSSVCCSKD